MAINKVGDWYFVCILNQNKGAWGKSVKEAIHLTLIQADTNPAFA